MLILYTRVPCYNFTSVKKNLTPSKIRRTAAKNWPVIVLLFAIVVNLVQFPFIRNSTSIHWQAPYVSESADLLESNSSTLPKNFTRTHNLFLEFEDFAKDSKLYLHAESKIDGDSIAKFISISQVQSVTKTDFDRTITASDFNDKPIYKVTGSFFPSPRIYKDGKPPVKWSIYSRKNTKPSEFILYKNNNEAWFFVDLELFDAITIEQIKESA